MTEQKKEWSRKVFSSKLVTLLIILALFWILIATVRMSWKKWQLTKETDKLENKVKELKKNNQDLTQLLGYLQSPQYLEKEARKKLGLKQEGEEVVVVPQAVEENLKAQAAEEKKDAKNQPVIKSLPKWLAWLYYLIGKK